MTNDENGEVAARTTLRGVYIDTSLRKARPLPPEIKESLRLMVAITPQT